MGKTHYTDEELVARRGAYDKSWDAMGKLMDSYTYKVKLNKPIATRECRDWVKNYKCVISEDSSEDFILFSFLNKEEAIEFKLIWN